MRVFVTIAPLLISVAYGGTVRTLTMDGKRMEPVFLTLGKSSVLRFPENPRHAVLGNQNYYKIEFVGKDVTIQPQGVAATNLFVYAGESLYGFLLTPSGETDYDDLINVHRKGKKTATAPKRDKLKGQKIAIPPFFIVGIEKMWKIPWTENLAAVAIRIKNPNPWDITSSDIHLSLSQAAGKIQSQKTYFKNDALKGKQSVEARVVFRLDGPGDVFLDIMYGGKTAKAKIPWR